jgi:hypothetical protein
MAVPLTSIETMRPGYRPDDECVDFMARSVAEATGSTMPGQPGKQERQDCAVSDTIVTYQELAGSFRVMGPLHTGEFRSAVRPPTSRQKKRKAAEFDPDPAILEVRDGPAESCEDALIRLHSLVMGRASGMGSAVVPSKLLLFSTHAEHTTLVELFSAVLGAQQTADTVLRPRAAPTSTDYWSICVHDSLNSNTELDGRLLRGLGKYLSVYGGKTGDFKHVKQP